MKLGYRADNSADPTVLPGYLIIVIQEESDENKVFTIMRLSV